MLNLEGQSWWKAEGRIIGNCVKINSAQKWEQRRGITNALHISAWDLEDIFMVALSLIKIGTMDPTLYQGAAISQLLLRESHSLFRMWPLVDGLCFSGCSHTIVHINYINWTWCVSKRKEEKQWSWKRYWGSMGSRYDHIKFYVYKRFSKIKIFFSNCHSSRMLIKS